MNKIDRLFKKGSILDEACEQFSFRIDFYSKPNFYEAFMKLWDGMMAECGIGPIEFNHNKLNRIQQNIVNVDAVAESLNTTIDNILDTKTYIFPSLFGKGESPREDEQEFILFVNSHFIDIYVRNFEIDDYVVKICSMLYLVAYNLWKESVISMVDIHLNAGAREILGKDVYLSKEGFGGYTPINSEALHNQFSTYQFIDNGIRCVVKNFLSLVNVDIEEETQLMWEHILSSDCIYSMRGDESQESFHELFNRMTDCCQKYIDCVCAR